MSSKSAARQQNSRQDDVGSEKVIGTLVEVSQDGDLLVELDGPDGSARRCTAVATVPIEAGMVEQPVELTFVGDLDRPVITRVVDVRAVLRAQWDDLGRKVLGLDSDPHPLSELVDEVRVLACTVAWLDADGVITHGAVRVGTSRRSLRVHVRRWKRFHPRLGPELRSEIPTDARVRRQGVNAP